MSSGTLYDKIWDNHKVCTLWNGQDQLYVARHLMHEVTSPQAFETLKERGYHVRRPDLTFAVADHVIPTTLRARPYGDPSAEQMMSTLEQNVQKHNITYFAPGSGKQGVCHVTFPEEGIIRPGQLVVCGDSHTCTHGAFGALAFGIGTTQVSHVLATQTLAMTRLKVRKIDYIGDTPSGVSAKDLALYMIAKLGTQAGLGYVYEFAGKSIRTLGMEGRMTLCNMAIEAGARSGYINPDRTTFEYLRPHINTDWDTNAWTQVASDAVYDDIVSLDISRSAPMVTWGTRPDMGVDIDGKIPAGPMTKDMQDALVYMGLKPNSPIAGTSVDVVFIGSCTNGRLSDLVEASRIIKGKQVKARTLIVPGSERVKKSAEAMGLDRIFTEAGAEWRQPGCSMCLAMNPDRLQGYERCASTSNRNFKGRQGGPFGRTHLMSPLTAAATAVAGAIADPRGYL